MPRDESFWNPYRLIPVRDEVIRKAPVTDEKFSGRSGIIRCTLENLTPLFIGRNRLNNEMFITRKTEDGDRQVIPGSSLKGMLRSLAEIVGGGCFVSGFYDKRDTRFNPCDDASKLCITCRMFGMMEKGRGARVHKGQISISDAVCVETQPRKKRFQVLLSNHRTRHEPFYRSPHTGKLDGKSRKMYFHQPNRKDSVPIVPEKIKDHAPHIEAMLPGHHFNFEVQFSNLETEALNLLLYSLALEQNVQITTGEPGITLKGPLRHKIGNAKPLGLGSCQMTVEKMLLFADRRQRFATLRDLDVLIEGQELIAEIDERTKRFKTDTSPTMDAFRKMMIWDESDPRNFSYPDYPWFKNPANNGKVLKPI